MAISCNLWTRCLVKVRCSLSWNLLVSLFAGQQHTHRSRPSARSSPHCRSLSFNLLAPTSFHCSFGHLWIRMHFTTGLSHKSDLFPFFKISEFHSRTISTRKILKQNDWLLLSKFSVYFFIKFGKNVCSKYLKNRRKDENYYCTSR